MDWSNWIPPITVTMVVGVVGFLYRETISRYLAHSISGHFDEKLERLKSALRLSEQAVQTELQTKQQQIDALCASVMSSRSGRQAPIEKRRLEATERVWKAAVRVSFKSIVPRMLEGFKLEKVLEASSLDIEKRTRLFKMLDEVSGATKFTQSPDQTPIMEEQPFVSSAVWAYYSAYSAVIMHAVMLVSSMSKGLETKYFNFDAIRDVVKKVLPHQASGIDEHGITYCYMCATELLDKLLAAIQDDLDGKVQDADALRQYAEIMRAVTQVNNESDKREAEKAASRL